MAAIINAGTSGPGGIQIGGDASGVLQLQAGGNTISTISSTGISSLGITNGSTAAAGQIGEYIEVSVGPISVGSTSSPPTNMTSITLTPGDWDISGVVLYYGSSGGTYLAFSFGKIGRAHV